MLFECGMALSAVLLFTKFEKLSAEAVITLLQPEPFTTSTHKYHYLKCIGSKYFPNESNYSNYCIYYYKFPQWKCDDTVLKYQGRTYNRNPKYSDKCGTLLQGMPVVICYCTTDHCNSEEGILNIMKQTKGLLTLPRINDTEKDVPLNLSVSLFQCMKEDLEASLAAASRGKQSDFLGSTTFYVIIGITVGGIGLIILAAMLIPVFLNIRRERHKKWLEETWEERVRQAANEIKAQEGSKGYKQITKPGRKAVKGSAEGSKEVSGSKEGVASKEKEGVASKEPSAEKGSKDDIMKDDQLFPAAIGPNEGRPSAEAAGAAGGGRIPGGANAGFGGPERGYAGRGPQYGGNWPEFGGNGPQYGGTSLGYGEAGPGYDRAFGGRTSGSNEGFGFGQQRNF